MYSIRLEAAALFFFQLSTSLSLSLLRSYMKMTELAASTTDARARRTKLQTDMPGRLHHLGFNLD